MKKSLLTLIVMLLTIPAVAQEQEQEQEKSGQASGQMFIGDGSVGLPKITMMTTDGSSFGQVAFSTDISQLGGMAPDIFGLAQNNGVQKEIELVDEQLAQMKEINEEFTKRTQELFAGIHGENGNIDLSNIGNLASTIKSIKKEKEDKMKEVLLPHQFARLKQISLQTQMKRNGQSTLLANQDIVEALDLSEEQQEKIKERAEELKKELEEDIKELKEKSRQKLLKELTSDQRKKLEEMMGDDYTLETPSFMESARKRIEKMKSESKEDR